MAFIYALSDPDTGRVRYIGKAKRWQKRYMQHCCLPAITATTPRENWLRELILAGKKPAIHILEEAVNWDRAERKWIKYYRATHPDLLNIADGGKGVGHLHRAKAASIWSNLKTPVQIVKCQMKWSLKPLTRLEGASESRLALLDKIAKYERKTAKIKRGGAVALSLYNIELVQRLPHRFPDHAQRLRGLGCPGV